MPLWNRHRTGGLAIERPAAAAESPKNPVRLPQDNPIGRPAIPQNSSKRNASQGITSKHFLLDNGVLDHRHGRNQIDDNQRQRANSAGRG